MSDLLFRLVPLCKGQEGSGYTYYAVMQVSTGHFMVEGGEFKPLNIYHASVLHYHSEASAVTSAEDCGYVLDTEGQLLVRMSMNGVELSAMLNKLLGAFYKIQGKLVVQEGRVTADGGLFTFTIPADVKIVGLHCFPRHGWVLCEEESDSRNLTGRAWLPNTLWPHNVTTIK